MHNASKYKYPPMERPLGSGIWGRPTLADNLKHLAYYVASDDVWLTWCGEEVPADHKCPPIGQRADGTRGAVQTCTDCDRAYKEERATDATVAARAAAFSASMAKEKEPPRPPSKVRVVCGTCRAPVSPDASRCEACNAPFRYPIKG